ncbi:MAG: PfkB family carbohydrate kinase [Caulobacterales bacterium]
MARMAVVGALAWDEAVRLTAPLSRGGRIMATGSGGRLGGGAGNAGVALRRAGHAVSIAAWISDGPPAARVKAAAEAAGLDLANVREIRMAAPTTMILVEPDGERTILFIRNEGAPVVPDAPPQPFDALPWDGLYVRTVLPGMDLLAGAGAGPIVAHWPLPAAIAADVLVGSRDDLGAITDPFAAARAIAGPRLRAAIVTAGAEGAIAYYEGRRHHVPAAPAARVVDATGAGDVYAAGLLDALTAGADVEAAMAHAALWGRDAVETEGSAPLAARPGAFAPFVTSGGDAAMRT